MSSEDTLVIVPRRDILIDGEHCAADEPVEVRARTATQLLQGGFADIAKAPAAVQRENAAKPPAAGAETAAATATAPQKPAPPAQKRSSPKAP